MIDSFSKKHNPNEKNNRKRYTEYLKTRLSELDIDESLRVEEKDDLIHLSEIIYEYFRCYIVHESNDRTDNKFEIQLEFEPSGRFYSNSKILQDTVNLKTVIKADWLIEVLEEIYKLESTSSTSVFNL